MDDNLDVLLMILNSALIALNSKRYNIYDTENENYYIEGIYYDAESDKLVCEFAESGDSVHVQ